MAAFKKCPYCKGKHRLKKAYMKCKRSHHMDTWPK